MSNVASSPRRRLPIDQIDMSKHADWNRIDPATWRWESADQRLACILTLRGERWQANWYGDALKLGNPDEALTFAMTFIEHIQSLTPMTQLSSLSHVAHQSQPTQTTGSTPPAIPPLVIPQSAAASSLNRQTTPLEAAVHELQASEKELADLERLLSRKSEIKAKILASKNKIKRILDGKATTADVVSRESEKPRKSPAPGAWNPESTYQCDKCGAVKLGKDMLRPWGQRKAPVCAGECQPLEADPSEE